MKKILSIVLAAMMLLACCSALAEVPEGYPEIIEGLDFGGQTVYIYDWWSSGERVAEPDADLAKTYAYRDWLEETYNVKLVEIALSDWAGNPTELANMVMNGDNSKLCIIAIAADFTGAPLANDLFMPWTIDLSADKWNDAAISSMTKGGKVYGVQTGANEPRHMLYFNKRVLSEAGIDPETIYDMQADGTWTWDKLVELMDQVQRDIDNDGVIDIWGMTGNNDDLTLECVFSNGGTFFDFNDEGKLVITANSQNTLDGLQMRKDIHDTYCPPTPEGASWDWYKDFWKQGTTAFRVGSTWEGFNDNAEMADMADEWGAVMFPKGPAAEDYCYYVIPNVYGIPNVYDEATSLKIQQIYDLYTNPTPGVDDEDAWIGNKYNYTDERAVDETYAMMREGYATDNKTFLLGSVNDVLGPSLMWGPIDSMTPAEAVEAATPVWQDLCDIYNGDKTQEQVDAENAAEAAAAEEATTEEAPVEEVEEAPTEEGAGA